MSINKMFSEINPLNTINKKLTTIYGEIKGIKKNSKDLAPIKVIIDSISSEIDKINLIFTEEEKILSAKSILIQQLSLKSTNIHDYEFKVFSQWGDDGIIQYLCRKINITNKTFIEFGVEDYSEANTKFLLLNNNWSGYVIDGSKDAISKIHNQPYFWKYDLRAISAWITKENINTLMSDTGWEDVGLLHIDIDGNDFWIWKEMNISKLRPTIVILEYNSVFGSKKSLTIPYDDKFHRTNSHYSNLYFGASLKALVTLSKEKGYEFVGCNSSGNNAYFIRRDKLGEMVPITVVDGYVESKFRESRNKNNGLSYIRAEDRIKVIEGLPIFNTETNRIDKLKTT